MLRFFSILILLVLDYYLFKLKTVLPGFCSDPSPGSYLDYATLGTSLIKPGQKTPGPFVVTFYLSNYSLAWYCCQNQTHKKYPLQAEMSQHYLGNPQTLFLGQGGRMEHRYLHMRRDFSTWGEGGVLTAPPNFQYRNKSKL